MTAEERATRLSGQLFHLGRIGVALTAEQFHMLTEAIRSAQADARRDALEEAARAVEPGPPMESGHEFNEHCCCNRCEMIKAAEDIRDLATPDAGTETET